MAFDTIFDGTGFFWQCFTNMYDLSLPNLFRQRQRFLAALAWSGESR